MKQDPFIIKLHKMHRPSVSENIVDLSDAAPSCRATVTVRPSAADQSVACIGDLNTKVVLVSVRFF